jgi:hypothetical protein
MIRSSHAYSRKKHGTFEVKGCVMLSFQDHELKLKPMVAGV